MTESETTTTSPNFPQGGIERRAFLKITGLAIGGLALAAPTDACAFFWNIGRSNTPVTEIPDTWIRHFRPSVQEYVLFLERLRLRHVQIDQVITAHMRERGGVKNSLPPKSMWKNIRSTLFATDQLCDELGEPVRRIVSAYRSPEYNARCPGARRGSYHLHNMALDLQYRSSPRSVTAAARKLRNEGAFTGGVGRYSSFTHIDTRGRNADW